MALVCCKACSSGCAGACKALDTGCGLCSRGFSGIFCPRDYPSPLYPIGTTLLNAGAIYTVYALATGAFENYSTLRTWAIGALVAEVLNVVFSIYLYARFYFIKAANKPIEKEGWKLMMYDIGVYLYGWVFLFQLVWIVLGLVWLSAESPEGRAKTAVVWNLVLLIVYLLVCCPLLLCSLMTECCSTPRWQAGGAAGAGYGGGGGPGVYVGQHGGGPPPAAAPYQAYGGHQNSAPQSGYPVGGGGGGGGGGYYAPQQAQQTYPPKY